MICLILILAGSLISEVGETLSHGVMQISGEQTACDVKHFDGHHAHCHDVSERGDKHPGHHEADNHTHDTSFHLRTVLAAREPVSQRQKAAYAAAAPRSFPEQPDRPPKEGFKA